MVLPHFPHSLHSTHLPYPPTTPRLPMDKKINTGTLYRHKAYPNHIFLVVHVSDDVYAVNTTLDKPMHIAIDTFHRWFEPLGETYA